MDSCKYNFVKSDKNKLMCVLRSIAEDNRRLVEEKRVAVAK